MTQRMMTHAGTEVWVKARKRLLGKWFERVTSGQLRRLLQTHLVPFDELAKAGGYAELGHSTAQRIADDYHEFSRERAALIQSYLEGLCRGEQPLGQ